MSVILAFLLQSVLGDKIVQDALWASEAPPGLRAAFTVELTSSDARRIFRFDPRLSEDQRWYLVETDGEDAGLDRIAASWGNMPAPDSRLFPDDLRASLGRDLKLDDHGAAWRIVFQHTPSENDSDLDIWATQHLRAEAWIDPVRRHFLRLDYKLPRPVAGPDGGRLLSFEQTYLLDLAPLWGLSFVTQYRLKFEARAAFRLVRQEYLAVISEATFFFANAETQSAYLAEQASRAEPETGLNR